MDKQQEAELRSKLKSLFQSKYHSKKWQQMLIDFFGAREIRAIPRELTSEHNEKVEGRELGKLSLPGFEIGLYEFEIKKSYRIAFNRVGLRSLVKSYTTYEVDAALVVYYQGDRWRLSYICDLDESKTAPKRFTYLFGDANESYRTPIDRFLFLKDKVTPETLRDAFSVEALTTDFFNGYKAQFKKFCAHIGGEDKWQRDYVKKLLGRLVFLQFLQKKGWMGVPAANQKWEGGDPNYLRTLLDRHKGNDRLLTEVLEPLFFETLNRKRANDLADPILGERIRIPYLNGGLFDRDDLDRQRLDFPYAYFDGLIEFFSFYNFTIDENDPDDSDVGIDPEMLGHIFENLLEDNKDKGTYYTPKEIVQYMSQESLIQYLRSHTDASLHPSIERLIRAGEVEPVLQDRKVAVQIDDLFKAVKVCDPAIGSGAFPMGVLSEIFKCRRMLYGFMKNPKSFSPSKVKREIIQENIYGVDIEQGAVDIARLRFWLSLVVDEEQPQPLPNLDYKIMQGNSLLESFEGIDLSKFTERPRQGNYLELFGTIFEEQTREAIEPLIKRHFSVTNHPEKELIRAEIDAIIRQHIEDSLDRRKKELEGKEVYHKQRVASNREFIDNPATTPANRRKYNKNLKLEEIKLKQVQNQLRKVADSREHIRLVDRTNQPFFLWHLYFKDVFDRGGFDIVIANPPYIQLQGNGGFLATQLGDEGYETFIRTGDIYCLFYEKGMQILRDGGIETFITSNKWMRAAYGELTRGFIARYNPLQLIDVGPRIFQMATVDTNILVVQKCKNLGFLRAAAIDDKKALANISLAPMPIVGSGIWTIVSDKEQRIREKIAQRGLPLREWDIEIYRGVLTGYNDAFIIDTDKRNELVAADPKCADIIRPILRGKDIQRYHAAWAGLWLINVHNGIKEEKLSPIDIKHYKSVKEHLDKFYPFLVQRKDKGISPYNLRNCAYLLDFEKEKIVWKRIGSILRFCYDDTGSVVLDSTCFASGPDSKYLVAVLNSKMGNYLLQDAPKTGTGDLLISVQALEPVAIPRLSSDDQQPFITLVDQILAAKRENRDADTSVFEAQIDRMVYDLYGLTEDEIAIVEGREPQTDQESEPQTDPKMKTYDFFISHAAEDKELVRPLAEALRKAGCKVWYDEFEMKVGDSLRKKIDHGLANSRYGIVVISQNFINKNWTAYELNGMVAREIDGVKVVLPLWHNITKAEVMAYSPTLADKMALDTGKYEIPELVGKLMEVLEERAVVENASNV